MADGVVVGSALVRRLLDGGGPEGRGAFVADLRAGLDASPRALGTGPRPCRPCPLPPSGLPPPPYGWPASTPPVLGGAYGHGGAYVGTVRRSRRSAPGAAAPPVAGRGRRLRGRGRAGVGAALVATSGEPTTPTSGTGVSTTWRRSWRTSGAWSSPTR